MMPRFLDMVGPDFFLVALRYTLMEQEVLEAEFPYCERAGVGVVIGGVYNSEITATGRIPGAKYNYSDASEEVLAKVESNPGGLQITWNANGGGSAPIPACAFDCDIGHSWRR